MCSCTGNKTRAKDNCGADNSASLCRGSRARRKNHEQNKKKTVFANLDEFYLQRVVRSFGCLHDGNKSLKLLVIS